MQTKRSRDSFNYVRRHRLAAFTLIEVLSVIAIISLLIAILLPALSHARATGRRTMCASNLGQIAKGWHLYLDVSDGYFLQGVNTNVNYGGRQGAIDAFRVAKPLNTCMNLDVALDQPIKTFECPSDIGGGNIPGRNCDYYGTSYMTNLMLIGQDQLLVNPSDPCKTVFQAVNKRLKKMQFSKVSVAPGKLILEGDAGWINAWNRLDTTRIEWHVKPSMHNIVFLDCHAEFMRIRKGMHITDNYSVIPFAEIASDAALCQKEIPTP